MALVDLPDELMERLRQEAARRDISPDEVAAELLATQLPAECDDDAPSALDAFLASGRSGRTEPLDIHAAREDLAARRRTVGA